MNTKNDIETVKESIKNLIRQKSILAFKYAFGSDFIRYAKAIEDGNIKPFSLSVSEIRKHDKYCTVNGKRTWMYKYAIKEMADTGEITVGNSYQAADSASYAKQYPLNIDSLRIAISKFDIDIKLIKKSDTKEQIKSNWSEDDDFIDAPDQIETNRKWLSDVCYSENEYHKAKASLTKEKNYADYCKKQSKSHSNTYAFEESADYDWTNEEMSLREYINGLKKIDEYIKLKEQINGTENE